MRWARAVTPLRHRTYAWLIAGQLASNVGDMLYAIALPWYVLAGHGGALVLATVLAAYGIPRTVLMAIGGHAADRFRPWTVMMGADIVRAAAAAALGVAAVSGHADAAVLIAIALVLGAGEGMFLPASFSIIPSLLPADELQAGNALSSAGTQLATLLGPVIGGALVATLGPSPAFLADAGTFLISALTLGRIAAARRRPPAAAGAAAGATASVSLWRFVRAEPIMQLVLVVNVAANLGSGAVSEVALPALAHGPFRAGAGGYGVMIAAFGAGALAGTLVAAQSPQFARPAIVASVAFLVQAAVQACVPYVGGVDGAAAALAVVGTLNAFANILTLTAFQRWIPASMMGRVMGLVMLTSVGIFPVSVILGGVAVVHLGPAAVLPLAGATIALAVGFALTRPVWRRFGMAPRLTQPPSSSRR